MIKKKGLFITFEGGEATGKTTQIKYISKWLKNNKISHIITREPGGTKLAEQLRKIILSTKNSVNVNIEVMLLIASRIDHVNKIILPALNKGKIVFCDRFVDSTAVYQGYTNNFGINNVYKLHKEFINNIFPDITFYFNTNYSVIHKRLYKRINKNKYDVINKKFNNKINKGYLKISKNNKRFIIINASLTKKEISQIIKNKITNKLYNYGIRIKKN